MRLILWIMLAFLVAIIGVGSMYFIISHLVPKNSPATITTPVPTLPSPAVNNPISCLPFYVTPSTRVATEQTTVADVLTRLQAQCRADGIYDGSGRRIQFYGLPSCWGQPSIQDEAGLRQQEENIRRYRQQYTVIVVECAPA